MASNLPSNLHKHTAFRDKPYTHTINFPDGYPMPAQVTGELRRNGKIVPGISPAITVSGQSFTFTYPVEQLERISGLSDQYFLFDGIQMLGGQLNVMVGYGDPAVGSTEVQIVDGAITTVQMDGVEVVAGLVTQVEQAASEVENNKEQVAADTQVAVSSAQTAINEAGVAQDAADGAIAAKNEAVAARDEVVNRSPLRVATYAEMTSILELNKPRDYTVLNDEFQGVERVPYYWDGVELFVYGTLVEPQPVVV